MMKKVLIAYFSLTSRTEMMAQYIAEGIRISGHEAIVKKIADIKTPDGLAGYDGYIFGSPTHFRGVAEAMKTFLLSAREADLKGKPGGAFGSYTHDGSAPAIILDTLQYVYQMEPFELGPLNLKEALLEEPKRGEPITTHYIAGEVHGEVGEGMRACHDYGRVFGEKLSS
jgi:multimeric flavodoxin WrbA